MAKRVKTIEVFESQDNEIPNNSLPVATSMSARIKESGIDETLQSLIKAKFLPFISKIEEFREASYKINVTSEDQKDLIAKARELRLIAKSTRINADKERKILKEDSVKIGKVIQEAYNMLEMEITPIEEHLEAQEQFVERLRKERIDKLQKERYDIAEPLAEFIPMNLNFGDMEQEDFDKLIEGALAKKGLQEREEQQKKLAAELLEKQNEIKAQRIYDLRNLIDLHDDPDAFISKLGLLSDQEYQAEVKVLKEKKAISDKWKADEKLKAERFAEISMYLQYGPQIDVNTIHELPEENYREILRLKTAAYRSTIEPQAEQQRNYAGQSWQQPVTVPNQANSVVYEEIPHSTKKLTIDPSMESYNYISNTPTPTPAPVDSLPPDIFKETGIPNPFQDEKSILFDMAGNFRNLAWPTLPDNSSDKAKAILSNTKDLINKVITYIENNTNTL